MSLLTKQANDVFAGYDANGGTRAVSNQDAQRWGAEVEAILSALGISGNIRGAWNASSGIFPGGGTAARGDIWIATTGGTTGGQFFAKGDRLVAIANDASTSVFGGNWAVIPTSARAYVAAVDAGAGTANAIQVTAQDAVSNGQVVMFQLFRNTTSSLVTVSINGGFPLTLKTNRGADASSLTAGMEIWGRVRSSDNTFRLLNDQAVSALVAQAEAARDAAVAASSTAIGVPQYSTYPEARLVTVPAGLKQTMVGGRLHNRVATNPYTKSAYQDASGAWFSAVKLQSTGPVEVWVAWGQSEMRGVTGSPANIGGDRVARGNVLSYVRGTTIAGVADGWYAVGPEDDAWPFASSLSAVGSPFYLSAAKRADEIGGTVCIIPYAIGGAESGLFLQGGPMWAGLQASWSAALTAALPGRGGQTLTGLGKTLADVMLIWQGSADADYKLGTGDAAANADEWVVRWRTILNSLQSPSGASVPVTRAGTTKIVFFEMLYGATSGGAPGAGSPTDSRNADLHKLWLYTSSKRYQIAFVPMSGVNQSSLVTDPEKIGSFDNLHLNGAAYNEVDMRLSAVLDSFDVTAPKDITAADSNGFTICRTDGTFSSWSNTLTAATTAVAAGSIFRSSYALWTITMPSGYAVAQDPNVSPCQSSVLGTWVGVHGVTLGPPTTIQTYLMAATTQAGSITYRVRADGFWKRV